MASLASKPDLDVMKQVNRQFVTGVTVSTKGDSKSDSKDGSMQARVIADMRRRIIKGDMEPGAPLSELALAEEFGVSRTPTTPLAGLPIGGSHEA
ncbi:GntR family transcriptional regulator [Streptomyces sp. NPDC002143]